jgi:hypothetical protein
MKRCSMFMDWQYCENNHITKSHLYIQCNPHQNSSDILHRDIKRTLIVHMEAKRPQIDKAVLGKKNNTEDITILDFKIYYKAIVLKRAWHWPKKKKTDIKINGTK